MGIFGILLAMQGSMLVGLIVWIFMFSNRHKPPKMG